MRLQSKGVAIPISCPYCVNELENSWHLFTNCSYAQNCWREIELLQVITNYSFADWIFQVLTHSDTLELWKIVMILS